MNTYDIVSTNRQRPAAACCDHPTTPMPCLPFQDADYPCYWLNLDTDTLWANSAAQKSGLFAGNTITIQRMLEEYSALGGNKQPQNFSIAEGAGLTSFTVMPLQNGIFATSTQDSVPPISVIGHVMREPLSNTFAVLPLLNKKLEDADVQYIDEVQNNCYSLLRFTSNLESFYSFTGGALSLEPIHFTSLIKSLVSSASSVCKQERIPFTKDITSAPLQIMGNATHLAVAFLNILRNSLQFTREGNEISIRLREKNGRAILIIEDRGLGIKPAHLNKIFEAYYSVDPYGSAERQPPGLGLGLALAKQTIHSLGGIISAESRFGEGTRISISLPLCDPAETPLRSDAMDYLLNRYSPVYVQLGGYCRLPDF